MGRKFAPISAEELEAKIRRAAGETPADSDNRAGLFDIYELMNEHLLKDKKVSFDMENWEIARDSYRPEHPLASFLGVQTFAENGLTYWGMYAGGDWEYPVFFIVYWDGKKLRMYIPEDGNPWNTDTKEAYGNNEAKDLANAQKRWPEYFTADYDDGVEDSVDFDPAKIKADILSRLEPVGGPPAVKVKRPPEEEARLLFEDCINEMERLGFRPTFVERFNGGEMQFSIHSRLKFTLTPT